MAKEITAVELWDHANGVLTLTRQIEVWLTLCQEEPRDEGHHQQLRKSIAELHELLEKKYIIPEEFKEPPAPPYDEIPF